MLVALSLINFFVPMAADHSFSAFYFTLFAAGFVLAPITPVSGIALGKWFPPEERSIGIGIRDAGSFVGAMLSLVLCPILANPAVLGWRNTYYVLGIVAGCCAILYGIVAAETPQSSAFISDDERKELAVRVPAKKGVSLMDQLTGLKLFLYPAVWAVVLCHAIDNFNSRGVHAFLPIYYDKIGVDTVTAGTYLAIAELAAFFGRPLAATLDQALQANYLQRFGLAKCRKIATCSGFALVALTLVGVAHLRTIYSLTIVLSVSNLVAAFHTSGYRASYLDQTAMYQGILMGLGNMIATLPATMTGRIATYLGGPSPTADSFILVWYAVAAAQLLGCVSFLLFGSDRCLDSEIDQVAKQD